MAALSPNSPHLPFLVKAPDILHLIRNCVSEDFTGLGTHVQVAGSEDYLIGLDLLSIIELDRMRKNFDDIVSRFEANFLFGDQLRAADVKIVTAPSLEVLDPQARVIWALAKQQDAILAIFSRYGSDTCLEKGVEIKEDRIGISCISSSVIHLLQGEASSLQTFQSLHISSIVAFRGLDVYPLQNRIRNAASNQLNLFQNLSSSKR